MATRQSNLSVRQSNLTDVLQSNVLANTSVQLEPAPEPVQEAKQRRELRPYSAEQLEVLHNQLHLATKGRNKISQMK